MAPQLKTWEVKGRSRESASYIQSHAGSASDCRLRHRETTSLSFASLSCKISTGIYKLTSVCVCVCKEIRTTEFLPIGRNTHRVWICTDRKTK